MTLLLSIVHPLRRPGSYIWICLASALFLSGDCQVTLMSSASGGYVCQGNHVTFFCNATGSTSGLVWFLDGIIVHIYEQTESKLTNINDPSKTFSVLFRNVSSSKVRVSELIFPSLPSAPSFRVTCSFGGIDASMTTQILEQLPPPFIESTVVTNNPVMEVSWNHSSSFIDFYRVFLDTKLIAEVRNTKLLLNLSKCDRNFTLKITAVDRCNICNSSSSTIICETPTAKPVLATTTLTTESTADEIRQTSEYAYDTYVTAILILLLMSLIYLLAAVLIFIYIIYKLRMKLKPKPKPEPEPEPEQEQEPQQEPKQLKKILKSIELLSDEVSSIQNNTKGLSEQISELKHLSEQCCGKENIEP